MEGEGKTLRAVGFALLILAATIAAPALSAAQDAATGEPAAEPTPPQASVPGEPAPPPPPDPAKPKPAGADDDAAEEQGATPAVPASAPAAAPAPAPQPAVARAAGAQAKTSAASVSVGDNFYSPTSVSVFAGETVTWRNNGQAQHSATANDGSFDTGIFGPGASRSETFSRTGTFSYYCTVHGLSQSGTVRVASAGGGGGGGGGTGSSAASGSSEAAAVASPDAAGTSTSLPSTGLAVLGLGGTGLFLLVSGMLVERRAGARCRAGR